MNPSKDHIGELFYRAMAQKDVAELDNFYHPDLQFFDPVFGHLNRKETLSMWKMLFNASEDLSITFRVLPNSEKITRVEWMANYSFGKKRRPVANRVIAELILKDGKIIRHHDHFNLHRWAAQALGITGLLFGWTGFFKRKLRHRTRSWLIKFMKSNP